VTDRQTDRRTDQREFSSLDRVCITCSAVKTLLALEILLTSAVPASDTVIVYRFARWLF